ncbi:hypothetical protein AGDE_11867 [Angomonas deanei]|nr:hypothetical protein AGDE_11867 [Angomonas deanei]|eukprot:EPY25340.1 hypothetical protein AGDE_11867 [Angomonas deanei]
MLSHSSKDFKTFRYETTPLCETHNLFQMHHKEIAERLIRILLERHSGQFSTSKVQHKKEILQKDKQKRHAEEEEETGLESRGESTEAFEAFARLTIAFARDMKEKFFPYFEIFQSAIHAGLFDGKGQIIPDTTRLQLVFSVQAAWCRELMTYWTEPTHRLLVERIVRRYISQWYDTRDYIRRLTGELLAYLTRMCRPMLHIIVEASMNPLETAFEKFQQNKISEKTGSGDDEEDEEEEDDEASEADEKEKQSTDVVVQDGAVDSVFTLEEYIQADLPVDPVVDGLASLAADLFRGIKGSLSSSFEYYYVYLLVCFGLLNEEEVRRVITSNGSINEKECDFLETAFRQEGHHHPLLLREVGSAVLRRAFTTVLHETRKNSLKALENLSEEEEEIPMEETNGIGREREMVPTHRLLSAVIACLSKSAQVQHISMCGDLLFSFNCLLWNDSHELQSNLQPFAQFLVAALSSVSKQDGEKECHDAVSLAATVLKSVLPLCLSPYSETDSTVALDSDKALAFTLKKQKSFLPAAKAAVDLLLQLATHTSDTVQEQSQQVLLAFAQDVFQKNYAFCLEEERRMAEIGLDVRRRLQDREEAYMEEGGEEQEKRIPSMLTPFAITVLHAIGSWYLKSGCTTLHQSLRCFFHHTVDSLKSRRLVERSVLFAAIANDRTRHMSSSPLRQLMRARTIKKNAPNGPKSGDEDISEMLQQFILQFTQLFLETNRAASSSNEDKETAAQYLSTLITLVFILPDNEKKTALEEALQKVLSVCIGKGDNFSETSTSTVYSALHAQIAALLVHLSSGAARKKGKGKEGKHNFHHLGETIHILASQFRSASGRTDVDRTRLLQATELLLESLVHALGYTEGSAVRRSTLELLQLLKDSLTVDQQRELLLDVLTECLTSPMQRLRLLSLRLLRLLSQSGIVFGVGSGPAEGALVDWEKEGLHTVNAACLASLQKAEEFNPLSQVGDLNGLKEALAKISFDAERGVMVHPLQRIIVARSMIGLLHLKFAMAWPIALGTLVSLVRQEKTWPDANAKDEEGGEGGDGGNEPKRKVSPS